MGTLKLSNMLAQSICSGTLCILAKQNETINVLMFNIHDIYWAIKLIIFFSSFT